MDSAFQFQALPAELRLQVYRELLLSPAEIDPVYGRDVMSIYPAVLRVSRGIYEEAEPVLYKENVFAAKIPNLGFPSPMKLWHREGSEQTVVPLSSSRKISQIHLYAYIRDFPVTHSVEYFAKTNASRVVDKLSPNNLKLLKLTVYRSTIRHTVPPLFSAEANIYTNKELDVDLESLKKLRAKKFILDGPFLPESVNKMKSIIEGPIDEVLLEQSNKIAAEAESDVEQEFRVYYDGETDSEATGSDWQDEEGSESWKLDNWDPNRFSDLEEDEDEDEDARLEELFLER